MQTVSAWVPIVHCDWIYWQKCWHQVLNGCQERVRRVDSFVWYGVCIPRIFHLILQETIYGSISDGGRKTVCISETALIYALTLMFNVLKSLIAGYSVLCRGWTLYTSQANKISSKFKSPPLSDHDHWTLGAIRAMSDPFPPTSQILNQTRYKCSLLCFGQS